MKMDKTVSRMVMQAKNLSFETWKMFWKQIHVTWDNNNLLHSAFLRYYWIYYVCYFYNKLLQRKLWGELGSLNVFNLQWIEQQVTLDMFSPDTLLLSWHSTLCFLNKGHIFLPYKWGVLHVKRKKFNDFQDFFFQRGNSSWDATVYFLVS